MFHWQKKMQRILNLEAQPLNTRLTTAGLPGMQLPGCLQKGFLQARAAGREVPASLSLCSGHWLQKPLIISTDFHQHFLSQVSWNIGVLRSTPGSGTFPISLKSTDASPTFHQEFAETGISMNHLPSNKIQCFSPIQSSSCQALAICVRVLCLRVKGTRNKVMIKPP